MERIYCDPRPFIKEGVKYMIIPQELITEFLTIIVQIIIAVVGGFVMNYLRTKIGSEKMKQYYELAKTVVTATEQTFGGGNGSDKKDESRQILKHLTNNKLSDDQIDRLIESSVYEMNTLLKINGLKEKGKSM